MADLPELDAVPITHEHYDHCDLEAFSATWSAWCCRVSG
nr:hypothetical protein [Actinoplanes sp. NBRC 103695]